jgi:hypothetical protein
MPLPPPDGFAEPRLKPSFLFVQLTLAQLHSLHCNGYSDVAAVLYDNQRIEEFNHIRIRV